MKRHSFQRAAANAFARGELSPTAPLFERATPARDRPRFFVPAGTPCAVSTLSPLAWHPYTTRLDLPFDRFERYERSDGGPFYEFRHQGYLLLVHRSLVVHRDDLSDAP
jgi:hypothetical protein